MKLPIKVILGIIVVVTITSLFWPGFGAVQAQSSCKSFKAIAQATLPTSTRLAATDKWGGPLYAKLDDEFLLGIMSGNDGVVVRHGSIGEGSDGSYTIGFNCTSGPLYSCTDTMTVAVPNSVFPTPPPVFGDFHANTARVAGGTGRFEFASGNLNFGGPFIVWAVAGTPPFNGRFNAELSGDICGIE